MENSYISPKPRYPPRVMPRELRFLGTAGAGGLHAPIEGLGRPPLNDSVVPTRRTAAPVCVELRLKTTSPVPPTFANIAMGKALVLELPTVYVPPHFDILESE